MTTIGVLGGGQLGRMLALAGYPLGLDFVLLDPAPQAPAGQLAEILTAPFTDTLALDALASRSRLATYEFENVPLAAVRRVAERIDVFPPARALEVAQDRLSEKTLFRSLGIPTAPFSACASLEEVQGALAEIGAPAILKTRREGYDGKGQVVVRRPQDAAPAHAAIAGAPLLLEGFVKFERELSILAVRSRARAIAFWPLVENVHREGILRLSVAPAAPLSAELQACAEAHARRVLETLDYVGVLAIEFFQRGGELLANEMAPRVHNSGHWTIEGAVTSQFENHLRALLGWPLGDTSAVGACAMINLIATLPPVEPLLEVPGAHVHLYGKSPRPGRKLGHVTIVAPDVATLDARLARVAAVVDEPALRR
jgi:5-(carboxyamino)imidazole ribonucleotide synthase